MHHPDELVAVFRSSGRKVTPQRQCIFGVLYGNRAHPTAEAVHELARRQMETISLKTVYQTLHELVALGEVAALDLGTGPTRFDPDVAGTHHHLVCRGCGRVQDLHVDFSTVRVPDGATDGFEVGPAEVVFRGWCARCRSAVSAPPGDRTPSVGGSPAVQWPVQRAHQPRVETQTQADTQPEDIPADRSAPCRTYGSTYVSTYDNKEEAPPWLN